eukprot:1217849-Pyramimonas_sp.AAC.1
MNLTTPNNSNNDKNDPNHNNRAPAPTRRCMGDGGGGVAPLGMPPFLAARPVQEEQVGLESRATIFGDQWRW